MSWRGWIGLQLVRLKLFFKKHSRSPVHITQAIASATSLLVCLPEEEEEVILAAEMAHHLAMGLGIIKVMFIVHRKDMAALAGRFSKRAMIVYSKNDIGFFSLPKRVLVKRITGRRVDIAIDLNRKFRLLTAFLCVLSGARVRIGFRAKGSSSFFNFEYDQKDAYKPAFQVYRDLERVIGLVRPVEEVQEEWAG